MSLSNARVRAEHLLTRMTKLVKYINHMEDGKNVHLINDGCSEMDEIILTLEDNLGMFEQDASPHPRSITVEVYDSNQQLFTVVENGFVVHIEGNNITVVGRLVEGKIEKISVEDTAIAHSMGFIVPLGENHIKIVRGASPHPRSITVEVYDIGRQLFTMIVNGLILHIEGDNITVVGRLIEGKMEKISTENAAVARGLGFIVPLEHVSSEW